MDLYLNITSERILNINKHIHMFWETLDNVKYFLQISKNLGVRLPPGRLDTNRHFSVNNKLRSNVSANHFYFTRILRKHALFHYITVSRLITTYSRS